MNSPVGSRRVHVVSDQRILGVETARFCLARVGLGVNKKRRRNLAKVNYQIHTDAIKENLIPDTLTKQQINAVYALEADLLNVALFGITAKQWREQNPAVKGNMRDYANIHQLVCLANLKSMNAYYITGGVSQSERLPKLNALAISQMKVLLKYVPPIPLKQSNNYHP